MRLRNPSRCFSFPGLYWRRRRQLQSSILGQLRLHFSSSSSSSTFPPFIPASLSIFGQGSPPSIFAHFQNRRFTFPMQYSDKNTHTLLLVCPSLRQMGMYSLVHIPL